MNTNDYKFSELLQLLRSYRRAALDEHNSKEAPDNFYAHIKQLDIVAQKLGIADIPLDKSDYDEQPSTHIRWPTTEHAGIIRITDTVLRALLPDVTIEDCDTQRNLRNRGIFKRICERLRLPESYEICCMWSECVGIRWAILVESPELPDAKEVVGEGAEYPTITLQYVRTDDNQTHLVDILVTASRSIPVKGGPEWLLRAM